MPTGMFCVAYSMSYHKSALTKLQATTFQRFVKSRSIWIHLQQRILMLGHLEIFTVACATSTMLIE